MGRMTSLLVSIGVAAAVASSGFVAGRMDAAEPQATKAVVKPAPAVKDAVTKKKLAEKGGEKAKDDKDVAEPKRAAKGKAVVRARVIAKRAIAVQVAGIPNDQVQQYVQLLRPMERAEYYFIRNVCGLDKAQRKRVAKEGERALRIAARRFLEEQQKLMRGGWRPGVQQPDPQQILADVLGKSVPPLLSSDQAARYKDELDRRVASRKQVALDNLVAKLDQDLVLSAEQREKIGGALASNWNAAWGQSLQMLMNIEHFFPDIPDKLIAPFLTENQKAAWRRIPRNQNVFFGMAFNGQAENDPLDDVELVEARKEAEAEAEAARVKAEKNDAKAP